MKFVTSRAPSPDGKLMLLSRDSSTVTDVSDIATSMQSALENWSACEAALQLRYQQLNDGELVHAINVTETELIAPLPRAWQWLDGSCFMSHGHLMQKAFNLDQIEGADIYPLVYQGAGDNFSAWNDLIIVADEAHGADFEGEFGVIVDDVPMGASPDQALSAIRLVVLLNDISYRALAPREMKSGFGFVQAKGATAFAPVAVTPDELGNAWCEGRVCLPVEVKRSGEWFGAPKGDEMHFGFHQLISHAAKTRRIKAGTVFGSGTVSNNNAEAGQACIAELRAKEIIAYGKPITPFLHDGETVTISAPDGTGQSPFGEIRQTVQVENSDV